MNARLALAALGSVALSLLATAAPAADYPTKPVRVILPFAPGGSGDLTARVIGQKLGDLWKQQVVIENKAGAGGNLAYDTLARSPNDGYTLGMVSNNVTINASLYRTITYDVLTAFDPVIKTTVEPNVLVVPSTSPIKSLKELIDTAKAKPGGLTYASAGNGTTSHLSAELLKIKAGIDLRHVPYTSVGQAYTDLTQGVTEVFFAGQGFGMANIKAGKVRPLATTATTRSAVLPDVPTFAEAGLPGFEASVWLGIAAPAGTPKDIVAKISEDIAKVLKDPEVKEKFEGLGFQIVAEGPATFTPFIKAETASWAQVINATGIKVD